jgi:STE24 endopeptidase
MVLSAILLLLAVQAVQAMAAQPAAVSSSVPPTAGPAFDPAFDPPFDPVMATDAYLARLTPAQRARSDAYFEGGYWLDLWDFLWTLGAFGLLLATGTSARLRDAAERWVRFRPLQVLIYAVGFILMMTILLFPLTLYAGFFREHRYGLSNQTFAAWLRDDLVGLGLALVLGGLALVALYAVARRAPRTWWVWGAAVAVVFSVIAALIQPVFITPLFNRYSELRQEPLRSRIQSLARANGIPADHVYVVDSSRQSKRISANVSGFAGTLRISLNDNLLRRASPEAVEAVMGHEMGHYVLHHIYEMIVEVAVLLFVAFAFVRWAFGRAAARWGERWGVRGVADPAGLPLLAALFVLYFFVLTPVSNTIIRSNEAEADIFGLNASRQPDGFAEAALLLGEYRKLAPGPLEEAIFFDHPSGRSRILMAMRWKAEHLGEQGR